MHASSTQLARAHVTAHFSYWSCASDNGRSSPSEATIRISYPEHEKCILAV